MNNNMQDKIISLITEGNLTPTTPATILLQTAIQTMQLGVLQYLLPRLFPRDEKNHITGQKSPLALLDRAVILETLSPERVPAFELLCRRDPSLRTVHLGHMGPPLAWAILGNNLRLASFLLADGVDSADCQVNYQPAVVAAAGSASCAMMELLLDHGAVVEGTDALFAAVRNHRVDMLALLVEKRKAADINAVQPAVRERGLTPGPVLHLAIRRRDRAMVRVLMQRFHADPLAKDSEGKTAVDWAVLVTDEEILDMCLGGKEN
ncbi:ankyrin repeat domain-containing protein [Aspergillus novofumigatus IBT 16806]|uniref:Ankyrin n=1 Tax=Aspergillus novofumigatus (strain IBT 16806) TaxID=1392255 RepID=A0A2I1BZ09_ASPN1|nr:ankyrin [Aspergillus novofumigatus IBT 16806]PKX90584.1 ankyrin [Aspergillus novofumigatus IBT 16806]